MQWNDTQIPSNGTCSIPSTVLYCLNCYFSKVPTFWQFYHQINQLHTFVIRNRQLDCSHQLREENESSIWWSDPWKICLLQWLQGKGGVYSNPWNQLQKWQMGGKNLTAYCCNLWWFGINSISDWTMELWNYVYFLLGTCKNTATLQKSFVTYGS